MNDIMKKAINTRNEQAIKRLANIDSNRKWGMNKDTPIPNYKEYLIKLGWLYTHNLLK